MVTGTDPETGEPVELKTFYMWDEATNAAVPHTAEGAVPVLEGEFTVNGKRYVTQFTRLRKDMEPYTLEWTAETCDIPAEMVADVAEQYAAGPSIIDNGVGGIDKFGNNDVAGHCYALIASLTGNYGKRGTGCGIYGYHVTPYEAALGAWPLPEGMAPAPSPQGFYDVVKGDAIHGAMFFGDIPTQKAANWNKTLEWLDSLDFVCLADIYHSSVTDFVDLVLPVCSKFECADSVGGIKCANAHILANLKVLDPLFESKSDFYIEKGIAEAMGLGDLFPADGEEYARALLTTDDPQMAGFTLEKLQEAAARCASSARRISSPRRWASPTARLRVARSPITRRCWSSARPSPLGRRLARPIRRTRCARSTRCSSNHGALSPSACTRPTRARSGF